MIFCYGCSVLNQNGSASSAVVKSFAFDTVAFEKYLIRV